MSASNTWDCFRECVGRKIVGVLRVQDGERNLKLLIFDDGTGLTLNDNGAYWREASDTVAKFVGREKARLQELHDDLREALEADGLTTPEGA